MLKYIVIALTLFSCNNINRNNSLKISTESIDTIQTSPGKIIATPLVFEAAFIKGTTHTKGKSLLNLYGITIGKIKIISGHIIACDPLHIDEYGIPFTQVFPTGEFPVQLSIAKLGDEEVAAFARISFSDTPVVKWALALQEGQSPLPIEGQKMHGYSVDGGIGIFVDEVAAKALDKNSLESMEGTLYKEMEKHYHNSWKYTMYDFGQHNMAAFTTGPGDGYYGTYIGFDANGNPCRLLTDFRIMDWKK